MIDLRGIHYLLQKICCCTKQDENLVVYPTRIQERLERGGPCWLLKLRQMGTQRAQMKGVFPWLVRRTCRASTGDLCPAFAALVRHSTIYFFLTVHYFNSFVPIAQQAGQATVQGRLSLSMCLWGRQRACFWALWLNTGFYMYFLFYGTSGISYTSPVLSNVATRC